MSVLDPRTALKESGEEEATRLDEDYASHEQEGHGGHSRWMMIACCVPMLAIAVVIAASGAGFGFLVVAIGCTLMMALMMGGMPHGGGGGGR